MGLNNRKKRPPYGAQKETTTIQLYFTLACQIFQLVNLVSSHQTQGTLDFSGQVAIPALQFP